MNKITAWFMSILLAVLGAVAVFIPFGNPISDFIVRENAEIYLEENFSDTDYVVGTVNYDFKTGSYYVCIESPTSPDSSFTLFAGTDGKITFDTYESSVAEKWNTANRINCEYADKTRSVFEREDFPYNQYIAFGEIIFKESDVPEGEYIPDYAASTKDLVIDGVYDIVEFGAKAGRLTIYIYDDDVSVERLAEILLGIKEFCKDNGIAFYAIDCVLEYPDPENEGRAEVIGFLYKDIYEDGMTERVSISVEKAKEYRAKQDELNSKDF